MMKCPVDNATLVMTERAGVEIDYCPECRGIWLDRGELDKIVERAASEVPVQHHREYDEEHDRDRQESPKRDPRDGKKRRGSFIGDIFGGFGD